MPRPRDEGDENYLTVREAAEALGLTQQAIRNRITRGTIAYEVDFIDDKPHYRIPRAAAVPATAEDTKEVERKAASHAARLESVFEKGLDLLVSKLDAQNDQLADIAGKIARQREDVLAELRKQGEDRQLQFHEMVRLAEEIRDNQSGFRNDFKEIAERQVERAEKELGHQERIRAHEEKLQSTLDHLTSILAGEVQRSEVREKGGQLERRSLWSRVWRSISGE